MLVAFAKCRGSIFEQDMPWMGENTARAESSTYLCKNPLTNPIAPAPDPRVPPPPSLLSLYRFLQIFGFADKD